MDEKQLQFLYNEYAKGKGFKDYSEFKGLMSSEGSRKLFFDDANKELGFKDYNEFSDLLGLKKKVGGEISSPTELPSVSREYLDKGQELADGSFLKKIGEPDRSQLVSQYKSPDISLTQKPKKDYYSTKLEKGLIFDKEGQLYAPSSEALSKDITAAEQASLKKSTQKDLVEKSREMPVAEPAKEPTEEQGLLLNLVSALDRGFAKNFISNPMKGLGTFLQGTTKKVLGGSGEGDLSNALIRYGDYLNNAIDELTPQDEEFKNSLWDQAAQALGQVGSLVLTGGLTGAAGKGAALVAQAPKGAVATAASRIASQLSAPTSISAGLSMGQAEFDRAKQAGATDDQAFEAFYKNAVTGSVLETIPVMQFFKRFNKATAGGFVNYLKTKGVAGFTGGVEELTTEILQQLYANKTAKDIYNINQSILDGVGTSGGIGFGVGFLLNAMGANARILRKQGKTQDAIAIENQIEQYEDNLKNPKVTSGNTAKDIVTQGVEIGTQKAVQDLDRDLANNVITPEKYQEEIAFAEKAAQVADKIPETVTGESKVKSVELLVERNDIKQANQNLLQQKQSTDEAYHAGIDEEIKSNEEKIKAIDANVYDIAKKPSKDFGDKKYIVDGEEVSKEAFEALQGKPLGTKEIVAAEVKPLKDIEGLKGEQENIRTEASRKIVNAVRHIEGFEPYTGPLDGLYSALKEADEYHANSIFSKLNNLEKASEAVKNLPSYKGFMAEQAKLEVKPVEVKKEIKPTEVKAEAKPTESEKSDVEKTLYPTLSGSIPLSEALPNGVYKKISNDLFAYADKGDKIAAIVDRANGNIVSKSFWNAKDGKWQLPNKANLKDDAKRFGINEDVYIKKYQDAVDILNSEVKPTQAKAAEVKPTEVDLTSAEKMNASQNRYGIVKDGVEAGFIVATNPENNVVKIKGVTVNEELRGKNIAGEAYVKLAESLAKEGVSLESDSFDKMEPSATRVWEKLADKGLAVKGKNSYQFKTTEVKEEEIPAEEEVKVEAVKPEVKKGKLEAYKAKYGPKPKEKIEPIKIEDNGKPIIAKDPAENDIAIAKLAKQDNPVEESSIKAIEGKAEGDIKAKLNEVIAEVDDKIKLATRIEMVAMNDLKTDEASFQNREGLNLKKVDDIVANYNPSEFDPIIYWTDASGQKYTLNHHRFAAAQKLKLDEIPAQKLTYPLGHPKEFQVVPATDKAEAIDFAINRSNANRSMETAVERAKALRKLQKTGTKEEVNKFLEREGKNKTKIQNIAALNENGKTIDALKMFGDAEDVQLQKETEQRSDWIGEARRRISGLTNEHENEMFDFLMDKDASKRITSKADFISKVTSLAGGFDFNPENPLNLKRFKYQTEGERAYDERTGQLKSEIDTRQTKIDDLKARFSDPSRKDYIPTDSRDYEQTKKIADDQISKLNTEIKSFQQKLQEHYKEKGKYQGGIEQGGLFATKQITTEEISDMADIVKEFYDEGVIKLDDIKKEVAKELGYNSKSLKDAVEQAYNKMVMEYTPVEISKGVIGKVGEKLNELGEEIVVMLEDDESVFAKAAQLAETGGRVEFQATLPNGEKVTAKPVDASIVNGFYSPLELQINQMKQDKMPAKQWLDKLRGEEAKWTGLADWLSQQQGSLSKQEIKDWLQDNQIEINEIVKGRAEDLTEEQLKRLKYLEKLDAENPSGAMEDVEADSYDEFLTLLNIRDKRWNLNPTKFSDLQLEGEKEDYAEILVTLPSKSPTSKAQMQRKIDALNTKQQEEINKARAAYISNLGLNINDKKRYYFAVDENNNKVVYLAKDQDDLNNWKENKDDVLSIQQNAPAGIKNKEQYEEYFNTTSDLIDKLSSEIQVLELEIEKPQSKKDIKFQSYHYDEADILVHLRMNIRKDAQGNKVLFLEEVQSDWGQEGKKKGFTELSLNEIKRYDELKSVMPILSDAYRDIHQATGYAYKYDVSTSAEEFYKLSVKERKDKVNETHEKFQKRTNEFIDFLQKEIDKRNKKISDNVDEELLLEKKEYQLSKFLETVKSNREYIQASNELEELNQKIKDLNRESVKLEEKNSTDSEMVSSLNKDKDFDDFQYGLAIKNSDLTFDKKEYDKITIEYNELKDKITQRSIKKAPFVMDTNAWTKLGLKVALKEAVKQGADKIAWTTGEQQVGRYEDNFRKQVDKIETERYQALDRVKIIAYKNGNVVFDNILPTDGSKVYISGRDVSLEDVVGKDIAQKIKTGEQNQSFEGNQLTIGGSGMKGFYGSPSEGNLGILGNMAKSLFKQEPSKISIISSEARIKELQKEMDLHQDNQTYFLSERDKAYDNGDKEKALKMYDKANKSGQLKELVLSDIGKIWKYRGAADQLQYSIKITPELKAQVEIGLPLFMAKPSGDILGFTYGKTIYLNASKINPNTPIHEGGHIWTKWVKNNDPRLYDRGMELVKNSKYLERAKASKFYQEQAAKLPQGEREAYFQEEALAMAIGDKGAQFVAEAKKSSFKEWLDNLWDAIKNAAGFDNITAKELQNLTFDEFVKRAARDILSPKSQQELASINEGMAEAYKDLTINQKRQIINSKFDELLRVLKIEKICP